MFIRSTMLLAGLSFTTFAAQENIPLPPNYSGPESICGTTDDSQDVERYNGMLGPSIAFVDSHEGPVGQVQWNTNLRQVFNNPGNVNGVRWCTGTLIADNLFLTAGHCFDVHDNDGRNWDFPLVNGTNQEITPQQAATNMHINMNFQRDANGNLRAGTSFAIQQMIEYRHNGIDYAILQLAGNPGRQFGVQAVSAEIPQRGELLTMIQHPAGNPKVIEAGNYDGVEATGPLRGYMRYTDLDTRGGSSGSGVLNQDGELIGVHTNAGCTQNGGANRGVLINDILPHSNALNSLQTPTARDDFFNSWVYECRMRNTFTIRPLNNDAGAELQILSARAVSSGTYSTVDKLEIVGQTIKVTGKLCDFRINYTIGNRWGLNCFN
ncbi:hypothetical protein N474_10480 [Pseudoalteromonas luteoviolacea CPMOR-2]|uniref:Serine protease n=1 Tax=Pseudoalteromonas luteoviolacea DSM 6061 TaxID=1365250 RepID=A0A166X2M6_9GAMM|nr:serine protease [Pseudoalteromonas luteoviolacea]KZN39177.1 hypothetical protein N475_15305 [Pseudoalteromonas luteoviolacea DSM 6061]KZN57039.1 hypothetical protein N474_10480 [Pseudoalteromonas luteoviolacea CPMOR-2]MBE0390070.1 hypothetical protein [Pseudoalteromonas luteoviolacea DSM 6061]